MAMGAALWCLILLIMISLVYGAIEFIASPQNTAVVIGQDLVLDCLAQDAAITGTLAQDAAVTGTLLYSWDFMGSPVRPSSLLFTNNSLLIPRVQQSDLGVYSCNVSADNFVTSESQSATVIEAYTEDFVAPPFSLESSLGQTIVFTCITGRSAPNPVVFWEKDGLPFLGGDQQNASYGDSDPLRLGKQFSLKLQLIVESSSVGVYRCVLENLLTSVVKKSDPAFLSLKVPEATPTIVKAPPPDLFAPDGQPISVDCVVEGNPAPTVRWLHNGVQVTNGDRVSVDTNGTLRFSPVGVADEGLYLCQGTNSGGSISSGYMTLQVQRLGLEFKQQPRDVHAIAGQTARIFCTPPTSVPPATVTWYKGATVFEERSGEFAASVIRTAAGGWDLYFSNVQQDDVGDYICVAFNNFTIPKTRTSEVARLSVTGGAVFTEPPVGQELIKGELLALRCLVKGIPTPTIRWYKDGAPLQLSKRVTMARNRQELYITGVIKPDEGMYLCNVLTQFNNVSASAYVRVLVPPAILSQIGHVTVNLGVVSEVTLPCMVSGDPTPEVTWFLGDVAVAESGRIRVVNDNLHIQEVTVMDSGNYTCQAKNSAGLKTDVGLVNVIVPPAFVVPPSSHSVTIGQGLTLRCEVTGVPQPAIYWTVNDTNPLPPEHRVPDDLSVVTIETITWNDLGKYTCHANNSAGQVERAAYLTVQTLPSVLRVTGQSVLPVRDDLSLTCETMGIPPPTITWLFQGQKVTASLDGRISFPTSNSLLVKVGQETDSGTYSCVSQNAAGQDIMSQEVFIYGPPVPPRLEAVTPVSTSLLNVTWSRRTQAPHANVTSYVLRYRQSVEAEFVLFRDDIPATSTFLELDGLQPAVSYVIVMAARNLAGEGNPSSALAGTTFESAPSVPRYFEVVSVGMYEVRLKWEIPSEPRGQIRQYQVKFKGTAETDYQTVLITRPTLPLQKFTLRSLRPHTAYLIQVRAATDLEREATVWGNYTDFLRATTLYAAPTGTPQNVTVISTNPRSMLVAWQPLPEAEVNGPITSYVIRYTSDSPSPINQSTSVPVSSNDVVISTNVFPWRYYTVAVSAVNGAGQGPFSELTSFLTPPEAPSGFPQELRVTAQEGERILVEWKPVSGEERNSPISGYWVEFGVSGEGQRDVINVTDPAVLTTTIRNLHPHTLYQIRVAAFTTEVSPGQGPYSPAQEIRTSETAPGRVTHLSYTVSADSIALRWQPPGVATGLVTQYIVRYRQVNEDNTSRPPVLTWKSNSTSVELRDLNPNTLYEVNVTAENGAGEGETTALTIKTAPLGASLPVVTELPPKPVRSPTPPTENPDKHIPAIVAGCLTGGFALLFVLGILIYRCLRKRCRQNDERYYMSKVEEDLDSVSDLQIKSSSSDPPSPSPPSHRTVHGAQAEPPSGSSQIQVQAAVNNNVHALTMPRSAKEKKLSGIDNAGFVDSTLGTREGSVRLSAEQVYSQVDKSRKKQYRMRTESAAAIAVERNRGIQVLTGDKDLLIHNEAEIIYDERTVL